MRQQGAKSGNRASVYVKEFFKHSHSVKTQIRNVDWVGEEGETTVELAGMRSWNHGLLCSIHQLLQQVARFHHLSVPIGGNHTGHVDAARRIDAGGVAPDVDRLREFLTIEVEETVPGKHPVDPVEIDVGRLER